MRAALFAMLALTVAACSPEPNPVPARCAAIAIDERELVVTDAPVSFDRVMTATNARDLFEGDFDLIAVVNRLDLATLGSGRRGELRFVFGPVDRAPLSVIVELTYPDSRAPEDWARLWHDGHSLTSIIEEVLASPHGQIRTQDARSVPAVMTELAVVPGHAPTRSRLFNTPPHDADSVALAEFVVKNEADVLESRAVLPDAMRASWLTVTVPSFDLSGVEPVTADAFARQTCNGCHTKESTLDGTFHVSPRRRGRDALSAFVRESELERRAHVHRQLLCR